MGRAVRIRLFVALACLVVLPGGSTASDGKAAALPPEKDKWIQVRTAHFTLYSNAYEKRTVELGRSLEEFRAVLAVFHANFRVDPPRPSHVYVFKSDDSFRPYKLQVDGRPVEVSGMFHGNPDANFVTMNAGSDEDPRTTIFHEFTHEFLSNNMAVVPPWFNEGLAEYYSTFEGDERSARLGRPVKEHAQFLAWNTFLPLDQLFAEDYDHTFYTEAARRGVFYAESWALVHYLLANGAERQEEASKFLDAFAEGLPAKDAFARAFNTPYEAMEKQLHDYVAGGRFNYIALTFSDKFKVDTSVTVTPMTRPEALARLGHLLIQLQPERLSDAEAHFKEALRLRPEEPQALAGMGRVMSAQGKFDAAIAHFSRAEGQLSGDPVFCYQYAHALLRGRLAIPSGAPAAAPGAADRARAKSLLEKALEAKPNFGEAYVTLGRLEMEEGGSPAAAVTALEKARTLLPTRVDVAAGLLGLYLLEGQRDKAQAIFERAIRPSGNKEVIEWASRALEYREHPREVAQEPAAGAQPESNTADTRIAPGGKGSESPIQFLERVLEATTDPVARKQVERQIEDARRKIDLPRQIQSFNQAVDLANQRNYDASLEILGRLLQEVKEPELLARVTEVHASVQQRAGKVPKSETAPTSPNGKP